MLGGLELDFLKLPDVRRRLCGSKKRTADSQKDSIKGVSEHSRGRVTLVWSQDNTEYNITNPITVMQILFRLAPISACKIHVVLVVVAPRRLNSAETKLGQERLTIFV